MKVVVLTTSYPRHEGDVAGLFVRDAVEGVRALGVEVEVVSPASFRHFGIAYGHGIAGNLRRRPWLALLLPAFLVSFALAARRAARDADLVHAHWLPSGIVALATGKPFVVQLWGTDVELARRARWLFRPILRRARLAIVASEYLADAARELGAREVRVIPSGVEIPESVGEPDDPPHVLFVGRLSPEKGIEEFLAATEGLPRVIVGAGPVDVPEAVGFVPHDELGALLRARGGRLRPLASRGLRRRRARGDGLRAARRRHGGRRAGRRGRGRRERAARAAGDVAALRAALERLLGDASCAPPGRRRRARRRALVAGGGRPRPRGCLRARIARSGWRHWAGRRPAPPSQSGISCVVRGSASRAGTARSGRVATEHRVRPQLDGHRPLGRVAQREAADAERRGLLLHSARVGEHEAASA